MELYWANFILIIRETNEATMPYFNTPVNLTHAAEIARRLCGRIAQAVPQDKDSEALEQANLIFAELFPYIYDNQFPNPAEQMVVVAHSLDLVDLLVKLIQIENCRNDRIGQSVRNLYECLGQGKLGATMGLLAGENPKSIQRPV
ncbi:MAG: hypothetical protein ACKVQS_02695 [Fimbriimonadaceae bacterium]